MFEIRFQGFLTIANVESGGMSRMRPVLYSVPTHEHVPLMTLRAQDIVSAPQETHLSNEATGTECYFLRTIEQTLLVQGTTDLPMSGSRSGSLAGVPHLTEISDGTTIASDVVNFIPTSALPVMIDLPDGTLSVYSWFDWTARFGASGNDACVPRTTLFSTNATANVKIFLTSGATQRVFELKSDSIVYITNAPTTNETTPHFSVMAQLFQIPSAVTVQEPTRVAACGFGSPINEMETCFDGSTLSVECSHTQFP